MNLQRLQTYKILQKDQGESQFWQFKFSWNQSQTFQERAIGWSQAIQWLISRDTSNWLMFFSFRRLKVTNIPCYGNRLYGVNFHWENYHRTTFFFLLPVIISFNYYPISWLYFPIYNFLPRLSNKIIYLPPAKKISYCWYAGVIKFWVQTDRTIRSEDVKNSTWLWFGPRSAWKCIWITYTCCTLIKALWSLDHDL